MDKSTWEKVETMLADWDDTAHANLTEVGRVYDECARDVRRALSLPAGEFAAYSPKDPPAE